MKTYSSLGQFSQQTPDFDFPHRSLPAHFHYIGLIERLPSGGGDFSFSPTERQAPYLLFLRHAEYGSRTGFIGASPKRAKGWTRRW